MLDLNGTHGTTISRAEKITKNGFILRRGRRGTGVYFWCDSYHAKDLAKSWWQQRKGQGAYSGDSSLNFALIIGYFKVNTKEYYNIETREIKNRIAILAAEKGIGNNIAKIAALYDYFLKRLEIAKSTEFKVVEMRVSPPQLLYCRYYPITALGDPYCYLVRNTDCIYKLEVEV